MNLTRRDALAALVSAGVIAGSSAAVLSRERNVDVGRDFEGSSVAVVEALVATALVVYPSTVENTQSFVETYAGTKLSERPAFRAAAAETVADLNAESRVFHDARFVDLAVGDRETMLRRVGAATADPDPDGILAERVRYYVVNEVLFALYASPTGGQLVGIENPQGHAGGTDSYQRGPPE